MRAFIGRVGRMARLSGGTVRAQGAPTRTVSLAALAAADVNAVWQHSQGHSLRHLSQQLVSSPRVWQQSTRAFSIVSTLAVRQRYKRPGKPGTANAVNVRVNEDITADAVRLIDNSGEQVGVVKIQDARLMAEEYGLDLVQVGDAAKPPVVKIMSFKEYLAARKKKQKKGSAKAMKVKQIMFTARTAKHDATTKARQIRKFLNKGHPVVINIRFQGNEPWRSQEQKRRLIVRFLIQYLGNEAHWNEGSLGVDADSINVRITPTRNPYKARQTAMRLERRLAYPIWPEAVAKAEAERERQAAKSAVTAAAAAGVELDAASIGLGDLSREYMDEWGVLDAINATPQAPVRDEGGEGGDDDDDDDLYFSDDDGIAGLDFDDSDSDDVLASTDDEPTDIVV